jgi:hypothetical protein
MGLQLSETASQLCARALPGCRYNPPVTLVIPALITLVGLAMLLGRNRPVVPVALAFTVTGIWLAGTWVGPVVMSVLNQLDQWIS